MSKQCKVPTSALCKRRREKLDNTTELEGYLPRQVRKDCGDRGEPAMALLFLYTVYIAAASIS
jgi:hypothetical protein